MNSEKRAELISVLILQSQLSDDSIQANISSCYENLDDNFQDYEIILINDQAIISKPANQLLHRIPSIRYLDCPYPLETELALNAGLESSIGDYVIIFNPERDPINLIIQSIDRCQEVDFIVGQTTNVKKSPGYFLLRPFANIILKEIGYNLPQNSTMFFCLSRETTNLLIKSHVNSHQIFAKIARSGMSFKAIHYKTLKIEKKLLLAGVSELLELMVFNTTKPLRWMSAIGVMGGIVAFGFAIYSFLVKLINNNVADGWSSTVIIISFFFMITFTILSLFGEYMNRLLSENAAKNKLWAIKEKTSSVKPNKTRFNVTEE